MDYLNAFWSCLMIAMAASSISYTITHTEIFSPFRLWTGKLGHMISYLFHCFYCTSHWVVFIGIFIYQPQIVHSNWLIADLVVSAFVTITLSTLISGLLFKVFLTALSVKAQDVELQERITKNSKK